MSARPGRPHALPAWWSPRLPDRQVLLSLAATPGALPAVTATRLADGEEPAGLLRPGSPEPARVAAQLDVLGLRLLLPEDPGWPFTSAPPDPPCAWLFVAGPDPPDAEASVAVVGGRKASTLRQATARSLAKGLAGAGLCVVSGGAVGVDAAAHAGALEAGGRTVVVLGCGADVPYPRGNVALFHRVRSSGGTLLGEHPPGARPRAENFLPRNRLIAALSSAVVVVEATSASGSLSTARAAGSRGAGRVLVVPGAPWDPGASGCNDLIRDGATLVRGLDDVLEALGTVTTGDPRRPAGPPRQPGPPDPRPRQPRQADRPAPSGPGPPSSPAPSGPGPAAGPVMPDGPRPPPGRMTLSGRDPPTGRTGPSRPGTSGGRTGSSRPGAAGGSAAPDAAWPPGTTTAARAVLQALADGQVLGLAGLAAATGLAAPDVASALLELELAGLVRRSAAGAEALTVPCPP